MAPPEFVHSNQGSEGLVDAPRRGSIAEELDSMEKTIAAQGEYVDQLIGQLRPIMREHEKVVKAVPEDDQSPLTELGSQIGRYTININQNTARIKLILELLEL